MAGSFPLGVETKIITFGRYSTGQGYPIGGTVTLGFADPMLHLPTGEVIVSGDETVTVENFSGSAAITVPVTVERDPAHPQLVANWHTQPYTNQRMKITVDVDGYPTETRYLEISPDDPAVMDFDTLQPFTTIGTTPVVRAAVTSVAGFGGDVSAGDLKSVLGIPAAPGDGLELIAHGGTRYIVTVDDNGVLRATPRL